MNTSNPTYTLIIDSSGNGIGAHAYYSSPASFPATEIQCTYEQSVNPTLYTVLNGVVAEALAPAQAVQIRTVTASYNSAINQTVSYTSKVGVTETYDADSTSVNTLTYSILGFQSTQTVPTGFYWVAADNTQVPFEYADLQGLASAIITRNAPLFQQLQTLKTQIKMATSVTAVQAIIWPITE
jgi:hypothetical protein